jgi:hypothetical protein
MHEKKQDKKQYFYYCQIPVVCRNVFFSLFDFLSLNRILLFLQNWINWLHHNQDLNQGNYCSIIFYCTHATSPRFFRMSFDPGDENSDRGYLLRSSWKSSPDLTTRIKPSACLEAVFFPHFSFWYDLCLRSLLNIDVFSSDSWDCSDCSQVIIIIVLNPHPAETPAYTVVLNPHPIVSPAIIVVLDPHPVVSPAVIVAQTAFSWRH